MISLDEVKEIHKKVHKLFTYVHDKKQYDIMEHWTSHAKDVNANRKFKDDCDGFALTCAELFIEQGHPKKDVMIMICKTENGEGHLVCGINIADVTYIAENRFMSVYKWSNKVNGQGKYEWLAFMTLDEPGQWKGFIDE